MDATNTPAVSSARTSGTPSAGARRGQPEGCAETRAAEGRLRSLFVLYALSGFIGVGYQLVWLRHFVDRFGSSTFTFALVISCFIGGLGLGALASARVMGWLRRAARDPGDLVLYGIVELAIAAAVALVFVEARVPIGLAGAFPYELVDGIWEPKLALHLLRVPLAIACVLAPCFLMGLTYPFLCEAFPERPRLPAALYAWNTLGACTVVLLCELFLFLKLGTQSTLHVLLALNIALGVFFVVRGRTLLARWRAPAHARARPQPAEAGPRPESRPLASASLLTGAVVSGFLSGGLEADALRRVHFAQVYNGAAMAFISFWAIAAIFAASVLVDRVRALRSGHIALLFALGFVAHWLVVHEVVGSAQAWVQSFAEAAVGRSGSDPDGTLQTLLFTAAVVGLITFPPYFCVSALLPWLCNALQAEGRHVGRAYGLNTLAFLAGMVAFSWAAPSVNMFYAFRLWTVVFLVLVVLVALLGRPWRQLRVAIAFAAAAAGVAAFAAPRTFDRSLFPPQHILRSYPIRALKGSPAFTSFVATAPEGDAVFLDTGQMSNTSHVAKRYMKLMIHFPLLAQPDPRSALLICFGVGNSGSAIARHSTIERIDVVDLSRNILETAPEFAFHNDRIWTDRRVRMVHDDGRSFLALSRDRYDLISSEPPPPLMDGIDRLYSREYYADVRAHLTERGCMTQWLPIYQMPPEAGRLIVRTFLRSFPHALLLTGHGTEFLLVGSGAPIDLACLERRFGQEALVAADLGDVLVPSAEHALATIVMDGAGLQAVCGDGPEISDETNALDRYWPTGRMLEFPYEPWTVRGLVAPELLATMPRLAAAFTDLHALRKLVPSFPAESLAHVEPSSGVIGADVRWRDLAPLSRAAENAGRSGDVQSSQRHVEASLRILPEQFELILAQGHAFLAARRIAQAEAWFRRCVDAFPEYAVGHYSLGLCQAQAGRFEDADASVTAALQRNPRSFDALVLAAKVAYQRGDRERTRTRLLSAQELKPHADEVRAMLKQLGG